jgi:hypothetical protein
VTTPASPDLAGVHQKIDRAEEHFKALDNEIMGFAGGGHISTEIRQNVLDDSYSVIFHQSAPTPLRFGLLLGDACQNVRSALNYLVVALVPAGQFHKRHQFPIFDSEHSWQSEFGGKRANKMLDFVDPAHVAAIESLQPYKPGGVTRLSILERFSNTDKHRLMHGAVANLIAKPEVIAARKVPMPTTSIDYLPGGHAIRDGDELARFRFSPYVYQRVSCPAGRPSWRPPWWTWPWAIRRKRRDG